ncbi:MAG: DUF6625 family protein [bacterium]
MKSIAIIIPYFGSWPPWVGLFFESCRRNATINFIFFTDCEPPVLDAPNIYFNRTCFIEYCKKASNILGVEFHSNRPYKLCDLRPFYGFIHQDILKGYDFWGFGDIDLVWGDIRKFYTEDILQKNDVLSTHADRLSGHLTLIRNTQYYTQLPFGIENWKELLCSPENHALDEIAFTRILYPAAPLMWKIHKHIFFRLKFHDEWKSYNRFCSCFNRLFKPRKLFFIEQNTTPWFTDTEAADPNVVASHRWYYHNGKILCQQTGAELPYLHFLSLKKYWKGDFCTVVDNWNNVEIGLQGIQFL